MLVSKRTFSCSPSSPVHAAIANRGLDRLAFARYISAARGKIKLPTRGFPFLRPISKSWPPNRVKFSTLKHYFPSKAEILGGILIGFEAIISKLGLKIRKSPSRFLTRKDGVAGAILRARLRRRTAISDQSTGYQGWESCVWWYQGRYRLLIVWRMKIATWFGVGEHRFQWY